MVITASPGPIPSAIRISSSASVPEETPMACFAPQYSASARSNSSTFGPRMKFCVPQDFVEFLPDRLRQRPVLFAQIEQGHAHGLPKHE